MRERRLKREKQLEAKRTRDEIAAREKEEEGQRQLEMIRPAGEVPSDTKHQER